MVEICLYWMKLVYSVALAYFDFLAEDYEVLQLENNRTV